MSDSMASVDSVASVADGKGLSAGDMAAALPGLVVLAIKIASGDKRIPGRDSWALRVLCEWAVQHHPYPEYRPRGTCFIRTDESGCGA